MSEWKEVKLGELGRVITGKTPFTKISSYYNGNIHFVTPADLNSCSKEILYTSKTISEEGLQSIKGSILPANSICVSCIGNLGYTGKTTMRCASNQQINSVIVDENKYDVDYIYYSILSLWKYFKSQENQSTTISIINKSSFSNISIFVPSIEKQRSIASILSSLDSKIECNRKICENLEAQAQALFKHWFIDFAPFKDGKFVESELGMIPEGWRVGRLEELGDIIGGATPSKAEESYYTSKGIAWLTPKDLSNKLLKFTSRGEIDLTFDGYNSCSAKLMPKGSVLFSSRAPIGYLTIAKNEICTNQGFKSIVPKYAGTAYIYYLLKINTKRIESMASGTTFKEASGALMKSLAVIIPPKHIIDEYEESVIEIFNEQEVLENESSRLSTLRDTLLPKLMSGELTINDINA